LRSKNEIRGKKNPKSRPFSPRNTGGILPLERTRAPLRGGGEAGGASRRAEEMERKGSPSREKRSARSKKKKKWSIGTPPWGGREEARFYFKQKKRGGGGFPASGKGKKPAWRTRKIELSGKRDLMKEKGEGVSQGGEKKEISPGREKERQVARGREKKSDRGFAGDGK